MPKAELKGQQIRIRINNPRKFTKFRTQDVGKNGRLQRIGGYSRKTGWLTQSWRLNLSTYSESGDALRDLDGLYGKRNITVKQWKEANHLILRYFRKR